MAQSARISAAFSLREGLLLLLGFVVVSVTFASFVGLVSTYAAPVALPMLSIAAIVLLLICLTGISYVFSRAGLEDRAHALALPAGSIQSVIALSLIVLFAILSIFLFTKMGEGGSLRVIKGLSAAERDIQVPALGASFAGWEPDPGGKFTIYIRDPGTDARNDVGKQLIVLIGTLMTSAVSFYFGSRATVAGAATNQVSAADAPRSSPAETPATISKIEPEGGIRRGSGPILVTITGSGLSEATDVTFKQDGVSLDVAGFSLTGAGLTCAVVAVDTNPLGDYDVAVLNADGKEIATRRSGLKII